MLNGFQLKPPFFQIVTKSYLFGDDVLALARAADAASKKYNVDVIFTAPFLELRRVVEATEHIFVFAPHMDSIVPGRGVADILPESLVAAGVKGVVLNHSEKPLSLSVLASRHGVRGPAGDRGRCRCPARVRPAVPRSPRRPPPDDTSLSFRAEPGVRP